MRSAPTEPPFGSPDDGLPALQVRGLRLEWGRRTYVMGVVNVTPDSFSGDGLDRDLEGVVARAEWMIEGGADILDVGGESSRPGAVPVSEADELARVVPAIDAIRGRFSVPISVDTSKASVAAAALDAGADIVNDVWALGGEPGLAELVAERKVPVVLMHNGSRDLAARHDDALGGYYEPPERTDIVTEVRDGIRAIVARAGEKGVAAEQIIVDPGLGFGKGRGENLALLNRLGEVRSLGHPVLVGPSRKSFIGLTLDVPPEDRVEGTAASIAVAICRGADIVRIHDVTVMSRVARMTDAIIGRG